MGVSKRLEFEKWAFVIYTFSSVLLVCIIGLLVLIALANTESSNSPQYDDKSRVYQYYQLDPTSGETSSGLMTMYEDLDRDDFLYYENSDGSHILVSNIGSNEYVCSGSCYCGDSAERRSVPLSHTSRGVTYLLTAATTILAGQLAMKYFDEYCRTNLQEMCSDEAKIKSEFKDCDLISPNEIDEGLEFGEKTIIFWCTGNCLPNIYGETEQIEYEVYDDHYPHCEEFGCEKLHYGGEVWLDPYLFITLPEKDKENYDAIRKHAELVFMEHHLKYFCIDNSWKELEEYTCEKFENEMDEDFSKEMRCEHANSDDVEHCKDIECKYLEPFTFKRPMCTGHKGSSYLSTGENVKNPTVVCKEMRRKTKAYQDKKKNESLETQQS